MDNIVKIYNAGNDFEAEMVIQLLEAEGIEVFAQDLGAGEYLKITTGLNVYGKDIYVADENVDRAIEVIKSLREKEKHARKDVPQKMPFYKNRVILVRIYLLIIATFLIFLTIYNIKY